MRSLSAKFQTLVRQLNYSQIQLSDVNVERIKVWAKTHMPLVVEELVERNWNLDADETWTELMFINNPLSWYGQRIFLYLTASYTDYKLAQKVLATKCFAQFRQDFGIDLHATILLDPVIFLVAEDLDALYCSFDFSKGYSVVDFSHYDDETDLLEENYVSDWDWLQAEAEDLQWNTLQTIKALPK